MGKVKDKKIKVRPKPFKMVMKNGHLAIKSSGSEPWEVIDHHYGICIIASEEWDMDFDESEDIEASIQRTEKLIVVFGLELKSENYKVSINLLKTEEKGEVLLSENMVTSDYDSIPEIVTEFMIRNKMIRKPVKVDRSKLEDFIEVGASELGMNEEIFIMNDEKTRMIGPYIKRGNCIFRDEDGNGPFLYTGRTYMHKTYF